MTRIRKILTFFWIFQCMTEYFTYYEMTSEAHWLLVLSTGSPGGHLVLLCQQRGESAHLHIVPHKLKWCSSPHNSLCSPQVQSEILKKWKRWKLGRNIEEEYRHTYSNTPHTKTGSLLNHVSRLPHLPDIAKTSPPVCTLEERHMLVARCCNGMVHTKEVEHCVRPLHKGTISSCTLEENISLTDKVQCYEGQRENVESHMWESLAVRTWRRNLEGLELFSGSMYCYVQAVKSWTLSSDSLVFARRSVPLGDWAVLATDRECQTTTPGYPASLCLLSIRHRKKLQLHIKADTPWKIIRTEIWNISIGGERSYDKNLKR